MRLRIVTAGAARVALAGLAATSTLVAVVVALVAPSTAGTASPDLFVAAGNGATSPAATSSGSSATTTSLDRPGAVAVDPVGNLLIADTSHALVDLVAKSATNPGYFLPAGAHWSVGATYAIAGGGTTTPMSTGVAATSARLNAPGAVTADGAGNVVIADTGDHEVEVLAESATNPGYYLPAGVSWLRGDLYVIAGGAGNSEAPSANGTVASATKLIAPQGLAVDSSGDVVVSDTGRSVVAVLAEGASNPGFALSNSATWSPGELYLLAGSGATSPTASGAPGVEAALAGSEGVAVDARGNVLVADTDNGLVEVLAESPTNPGYPLGLGASWAPGDLYVVAGQGSTSIATSSTGEVPAASSLLNLPTGVAVDPAGDVVIADGDDDLVAVLAVASTDPGYALAPGASWADDQLFVIAGTGASVPSVAGSRATGTALGQIGGIADAPSGAVVVADTGDSLAEQLDLVPGAPSVGSADGGDGSISVGWSPPSRDGGSPIIGFAVSAFAVGASTPTATAQAGADADGVMVSGLTNGVTYSIEVAAENAVGTGPPSNELTAEPLTPVVPTTTTTTTTPATSPPPASAPNGTSPSSGASTLSGSAKETSSAASSRPAVRLARRTVREVGERFRLDVSCSGAPCRGRIEVTLRHEVTLRIAGVETSASETTVIASGRYSLAASTTRIEVVPVAGGAVALLAGRRSLRSDVVITADGGRTLEIVASVKR